MVDTSVKGLPVMVFGASGALGRGVATALVAAGAEVTGFDKVAPSEDARVGGVTYREADVTSDASVAAVFAGEPVWAVLNTIGGFAPHRPLAELDPAELTGQLTLNLLTAALITKHALAAMAKSGSGRIVHTASRAGVVSKGNGFAYSVSKLGVLHLVSMAADEVRGTGITVNCVVPSIIDTPANRAAMPNSDHAAWPKVPDIAQTYLYLASPEANLVNGAALPV
ncbi:MAG TPA: SDR family NAD(P)-dependent oxidoreductase [Streptosporangiaceae bacterium]|nr:SDR family NAD(P)-dependent oxidoreductase [Streptosporangiaceae bacterium]